MIRSNNSAELKLTIGLDLGDDRAGTAFCHQIYYNRSEVHTCLSFLLSPDGVLSPLSSCPYGL